MLFDILVILSPTLLLGTGLMLRDRRRRTAEPYWDDTPEAWNDDLPAGLARAAEPENQGRAEPLLRTPAAEDLPEEAQIIAQRDAAIASLRPQPADAAPAFRTSRKAAPTAIRREPPLTARPAPQAERETFYIDFDEEPQETA